MDSEAKVRERVAQFNDLLGQGYSQSEAAILVDDTIANLHPDDRMRNKTPGQKRFYSSPTITEYGSLVELTGDQLDPQCHTQFST